MSSDVDIILVGGGLANGLLAHRLRAVQPRLRVVVLERAARLGGNHTWSFHDGDLSPEQHEWIQPFVEHRWASHEVRFPGLRRHLEQPYYSITSERLHHVISDGLGADARVGTAVSGLSRNEVRLQDGSKLSARVVVDGRGWDGSPHVGFAFQKFVGQVVETEGRHELDHAILMDAEVEQHEGFRFVYTLPLGPRRLLIEDTRYSDSPNLDRDKMRKQLQEYAVERGLGPIRKLREEEGVLPVVLTGDIDAFWRETDPDIPRTGMRAALFHPTTGYSLPYAARVADSICAWIGEQPRLDGRHLAARIQNLSRESWKRAAFFRFLNRMLFRAADPQRRYRVLRHFYTKPDALIRRFYAGRLLWHDRVRLLSGIPPVPVHRAIRCLRGKHSHHVTARKASDS